MDEWGPVGPQACWHLVLLLISQQPWTAACLSETLFPQQKIQRHVNDHSSALPSLSLEKQQLLQIKSFL